MSTISTPLSMLPAYVGQEGVAWTSTSHVLPIFANLRKGKRARRDEIVKG